MNEPRSVETRLVLIELGIVFGVFTMAMVSLKWMQVALSGPMATVSAVMTIFVLHHFRQLSIPLGLSRPKSLSLTLALPIAALAATAFAGIGLLAYFQDVDIISRV